VDDTQCDDGLGCTASLCEGGRCHFAPDDTACEDGVYCNGVEECLPGVGCRPGLPITCSDGTPCTIDACIEATRTCTHAPRDADGDGDPDGNCTGGHDCNEADPLVSSLASEICGNSVDDDCDGTEDEPGCSQPRYDTCSDPLDVTAAATTFLSAKVAALDYSATCLAGTTALRDLVATVHVPPGAPVDVDVSLSAKSGNVRLAAYSECGIAASEVACDAGKGSSASGNVSRLLLRGVAAGAAIPVGIFTDATDSISLRVAFPAASTAPTNETCGTAIPLVPGVPVVASLAGTTLDVPSACGTTAFDLVYSFELTEPRDVAAYAAPRDSFGTPLLSLRSEACVASTEELACNRAANAMVFRRALPAGRYTLVVGSTGPSEVDVVLESRSPTSAPPGDACGAAQALTPAVTIATDLAGYEDDIPAGCVVGSRDAAYGLSVGASSDVLVSLGTSSNDQPSVSLADAACTSTLVCAASRTNPLRIASRGLAAGEYRVIVESSAGSPVAVTAFVRPASAPILVAFADACGQAVEIPPSGGLFQGNTANAADDFSAGCDLGGVGGSPDQILHLALDRTSRVVLDARGSSFATIVDVRSGSSCPGLEVPGACSAGYDKDRSFVDAVLDAGDYWIQIDGYGNDSGSWTLDTFVTPTPAP
jgi:hypothetical protein